MWYRLVQAGLSLQGVPWQGKLRYQSRHGQRRSSLCESSELPDHQCFLSRWCPKHQRTDHTCELKLMLT